MAKNHSTVAYVEPNFVFSGLTAAAGDGETHDRAPDLEDYCISLDIIVEVSSRHKDLKSMPSENRVIVMSYEDRKGGKGTVRFMSGTIVGGYHKDDNGTFTPNLSAPNVMTTYYADMHISDLVDYGTTELVGIKSVDIDYNSTFVPIITVTFTDVRGMSIFQPNELNDDLSFNGIRGFSKGNIAQSFFYAFFALPIPKFTIVLKGFYGKPVAYQMTCSKFDTAFNSQTGSFDVTAKFIGYAYSFMTDISFNALLAAPFSDYIGEDYWNSKVKEGKFSLPDKNGNPQPMPKLYEIVRDIDTLIIESDEKDNLTTEEEESNTHELEIQELTKFKDMYWTWYDGLYNYLCNRYGSDYVYKLGGENKDDDYRCVFILTNGKNIEGGDLSTEYLGFDTSIRELTGQLSNAISRYNSLDNSFKKLENIKDGFKYPRVKMFKEVWINDRTNLYMFDGFHTSNILPKKEVIDAVFGESAAGQQKSLKCIYNDGKYQYIDAFVINLDYTGIKKRINTLIADANKQLTDKEKKNKVINQHIYEKMRWYPSIENLTKIVMAHLETLMAMMYNVMDSTKSRTVSDLALPSGDFGLVDVNPYDTHVAPFPRVTRQTTDSDGLVKSEDVWVGNLNDGIGFKEVDMVNGLFNGVNKIRKLQEVIDATVNNINRADTEENLGALTVMEFPVTSYDFTLKKNPYGTESNLVNDLNAFVGKVCLRMFGILSLNFFRLEFHDKETGKENWLDLAEKLGRIEAYNFAKLNKITNPNLMTAINNGGCLENGDAFLNIVTGTNTSTGTLPWGGDNGNMPLFSGGDDFWLSRYRVSPKCGIYPIQDFSFPKLERFFGYVSQGKVPIGDEDDVMFGNYSHLGGIASNVVYGYNESTIMNTIQITDRYKEIWEKLENSQSCGVNDYTELAKSLSTNIIPDGDDVSSDFISQDNKSFNKKVDDYYLMTGTKNTEYIPLKPLDETMYAGGSTTRSKEDREDRYYHFNGDSYVQEMTDRSIQSYTLTECFGFKVDSDGFWPDKRISLFTTPKYYEMGLNTDSEMRATFFIMGIDSINYSAIASRMTKKSFIYLPNLAVLQIGAMIYTYYIRKKITNICNKIDLSDLRKFILLPLNIGEIENVINLMSPQCKIGFAKYFNNWADKNGQRIKLLDISWVHDKKTGTLKFFSKGNITENQYEKIMCKVDEGKVFSPRALFNQSSNNIQYLTNDLMSLVCVIKLTTGSIDLKPNDGTDNKDELSKTAFKFKESQAKAYLDSFVKTLREINGLEKSENNGGPTTIAKNPSNTTEDMKVELYRYLKQLYDKWVSTANFNTWSFESFFDSKESNVNDDGINHKFYFIDSFYNKIGDKLLINPNKLSLVIKLATSSMDVNVTMHSFLQDIYTEHRCMIKCVQNFKLLSDGIADLFVPLPYTTYTGDFVTSDFVVIYTYEASKYLSIGNSEYKDDGFMLNDEFETPIPIKSRSDEDRFYKIPAFGVSYGKQYQNYFKSVNVNMDSPIMTEQAIIAKMTILAGSRSNVYKSTSAQDIYDIYSNQSYTCTVEMMGCAYVQPLMYFVLLNVPFFKGSYLISKVRHKMIPGDMTTEITGVRMSKYCNKMVTDMFSDEDENEVSEYGGYEETKHKKADMTNDCPYKVFHIGEDLNGLTGTEKQKAKQLMDLVASVIYNVTTPITNDSVKIAAAGIVGNMRQETGEMLDHTTGNTDNNGFIAAGLCGWNDKFGNLTHLLNKNTTYYGKEEDPKRDSIGLGVDGVRKKLRDIGLNYQIQFLKETIGQVTVKKGSNIAYSANKLKACKTPSDAATSFFEAYERGDSKSLKNRQEFAKEFYNSYDSTTTSTTEKVNKYNQKFVYAKWFFNAIQKSVNSTENYGGELKVEYKANGSIRITRSDNNIDKLAIVFDIILNGYYDHMQNIVWEYSNAPSESPSAIMVKPVVKVNIPERTVIIATSNGTITSFNDKDIENKQLNERFMQSLGKRYRDESMFKKECPQFADTNNALNNYRPSDCNSLFNNGSRGVAENPSEVAPSAKITIDGWDVEKSIEWINSHAQPCKKLPNGKIKCGNRQCASYVEDAIGCSGSGLKRVHTGDKGGETKHATNLWYYGILEDIDGNGNGFRIIKLGDCTPTDAGRKTNISLQAGDVAIIGRNAKVEGGKYHACIWNGSQWVSDFFQGEMMSPYSSSSDYPDGTLPYAIFRYHNKEGTLKA